MNTCRFVWYSRAASRHFYNEHTFHLLNSKSERSFLMSSVLGGSRRKHLKERHKSSNRVKARRTYLRLLVNPEIYLSCSLGYISWVAGYSLDFNWLLSRFFLQKYIDEIRKLKGIKRAIDLKIRYI